jgi:YARHG domain
MKVISSLALAATLVTTASAFVAAPAAAQDDQVVCENLWVQRNQIYKDNGYCFKSANAISYFGNGGCVHDDLPTAQMSKSERRIVNRIRNRELKLGCDDV